MTEANKDTLNDLDLLLGSSLRELLSTVPNSHQVVRECLQQNSRIFDQYTTSKQLSTDADVHEHFISEIHRMNACLPSWNLQTVNGTQEAAEHTLKGAEHNSITGIYLKESSAQSILRALPPEKLVRHVGKGSQERLYDTFSPLECIALSRHTESKEWQQAYLTALSELGAEKFEERSIRYLVVDPEAHQQVFAESGRMMKPWAMSHSKETGFITCFTHAHTLKTPKILFASLFMHYYEEIGRAASSVKHPPSRSPGIGYHIAAIIRSTQRKLPFFNQNLHSEALYWEKGLQRLAQVFPSTRMNTYTPLLSCGNFLDEAMPTSLNVIDHIWNVNFGDKETGYFKGGTKRFVYHFREALWTEILRQLRSLERDEMSHAIFHSLDIDDVELTRMMLSKVGQSPSIWSRIARSLARVRSKRAR